MPDTDSSARDERTSSLKGNMWWSAIVTGVGVSGVSELADRIPQFSTCDDG